MAARDELVPVGAVTPVLRAHELYRFYHAGDEETLALRGVSLEVAAGEMVAIVGPSGSGKSTLLACLAGLDEPDGGTVFIGSERLSRRPEQHKAAIRARSIGVLFQSGNLLAHLDVSANILLAQRLHGRVDAARVRAVLERVGLSGRARSHPTRLAGGELARAGLAVALANDPPLLLADEPTGELDQYNARAIVSLLRERATDGMAVVAMTHNPRVSEAADRTLTLVDGRLAA